MLLYSGCSVLYMFTLVKCPPLWFYRVVCRLERRERERRRREKIRAS